MENIVVAVFETYDQAHLVAQELERAGINPASVQISPDIRHASTGQDGAGTAMPSDGDDGRAGNCVLTVDAASPAQRMQAREIMSRHRPLDLDERAGHWGSDGWISDAQPDADSPARQAAGEGAAPPAGGHRGAAGARGAAPGR